MRPNHTSRAKVTYKRHILGMLSSPLNDSDRQQLWRLTCSAITNTILSTVPKSGVLGTWKNSCTETRKLFTAARMRKAIHVCCFKNGRNQCRISGWKAALPWEQKKTNTFWHPGAEPLGRFPPFFLCECTPCPLTYIPNFILIGSGLGKLYPKNMSTRPKENAI